MKGIPSIQRAGRWVGDWAYYVVQQFSEGRGFFIAIFSGRIGGGGLAMGGRNTSLVNVL